VQDSQLRASAFKVVEEKKFKKFVNEIANPNLTPDFYKWKYYGLAKEYQHIPYSLIVYHYAPK
jgi:hypothetical protein